MNLQDFEKELEQMKIPKIEMLKHQEILAEAFENAKRKSVISWWWLVVPIYLIASFLMKSYYFPKTTWVLLLQKWAEVNPFLFSFLFFLLPAFILISNLFNIRKIYILTAKPSILSFIPSVITNIIISSLALIILLIYFL